MADNNIRLTRAAARAQQQAQQQEGQASQAGGAIQQQPAQPQRVQQALGPDAPDVGEPEITEEEVEDEDDFFPNLEQDENEVEEEEAETDEETDAHYNEQKQDIIDPTQDDIMQNLLFQNAPNPNHLPFDFCNNSGTVLFYYFLGLYTGDGI